ncbi:MAG: SDR family oxidoreductase [Chloroflexota bacterium]|jgi:NAD(P)-dependent dehydrogenase (short-subunit alcohol dehydrogenase family)|nr:SDR family oxidoreductase [Dehalococcoidia bacterium]MDW8047407.1 SDR family oxidoreductase [Chloroflexota bacterium]
MQLDGRVAIITGAGSGIGKAIAQRFAREGARVLVADLIAERAEASAAEIAGAGGEAFALAADVGAPEDAARLVAAAVERWGRLDILCNNAGIMDRMAPAADTPLDLWDRVLRVNLTGPFLLCREALPVMLRQGAGAIVNIASVGGLHGGRAGAAYTASKHGLIGLTKNIAFMYAAQNIRCNAICPGPVQTAIGLGGEPNAFGLARMQLGASLMPRIAQPEEIAAVALFLASDEASFVNGAVLVADGGWTAY